MIDISNEEIIVRWHHDVTRHGSQDCHNYKAFMLCKVRWKYNILIFDEIGSNHNTTIDHLWFKLILDSPRNISIWIYWSESNSWIYDVYIYI
jgi:hypothetical protein